MLLKCKCSVFRNDLLVIASLVVSLCPSSPFMVGKLTVEN